MMGKKSSDRCEVQLFTVVVGSEYSSDRCEVQLFTVVVGSEYSCISSD